MTTATEYRFEIRNADEPDEWHETTEDYIRSLLRADDPNLDSGDLDQIVETMRSGDEGNDTTTVFRAVPVTLPSDTRIGGGGDYGLFFAGYGFL